MLRFIPVIGGIAGLLLAVLSPIPAAAAPPAVKEFHRQATLPSESITGGDAPTAASATAVTKNGKTVVYTDGPGKALGLVGITDPAQPEPAGAIGLDAEPTSVATTEESILAVVDTSADHVNTSGQLLIIDVETHEITAEIELGGQPESIAVGPAETHAVVTIENERDPDVANGDPPQPPPGFLVVIELATEQVSQVDLTGLAEIVPEDPEPESVAVNEQNQAAVTLQENNHVVVVDLPTASVIADFSAGTAHVSGVDIADDRRIDPDAAIEQRREPDGVAWIGDDQIATANEGDWQGGTRGWTVFDTDGTVVFDSGNDITEHAIEHGLYPDHRSDEHGTEPETIVSGEVDGVPYVFVAAEQGNFVAVYDITDPAEPDFVQMLPTTNGPEGISVVPGGDVVAVASEHVDPEAGIPSTVQLYELAPGQADFPSIVSEGTGWGALSGLSSDPEDDNGLYAVSDGDLADTKLYRLDVEEAPAVISEAITVTEDGEAADYDAEAVAARPEGGFWLAAEGDPEEGVPNLLVELNDQAEVVEEIPLPEEVADKVTGKGLSGVTTIGDGDDEEVWVSLFDELAGEAHHRIGKFEPGSGEWSWVAIDAAEPATPGAEVLISGITRIDENRLAIIERDDQQGDAAQIKQIYSIALTDSEPPSPDDPPLVETFLAVDVLPFLAADNGWVQEKLAGLAVAGNGDFYTVTDNDFLIDSTGETVFTDLGPVGELFPDAPTPAQLPATGPSPTSLLGGAIAALATGTALLRLRRRRSPGIG